MDGWYGRIFGGSGFFDMDKPIKRFTKKERHDLLYREPTKIKVDGINLTYEGLIPKIQKSMLSKDVEAMQPHVRAFVERAVTFTTCPDCEGTRLGPEAQLIEDQGQEHRRPVRPADQRPRRVGPRTRRGRRWRRCSGGCSTCSTPSPGSASATSPSTVRRERCPGERHSAPR